MSKSSRQEYLQVTQIRYQQANKKIKQQLLDEACRITSYHRTYVARVLRSNGKPKLSPTTTQTPRRRRCKYSKVTKRTVVKLWRAANSIAAARLHPFIPDLLAKMLACGEIKTDEVSQEVVEQLEQISLATVKRILSKASSINTVKLGGTTKPGSLLKRQITIRYGRWNEQTPGWCETDTVAHCGESLLGAFVYSLNVVDICSGWSEQIAILGKGSRAVTTGMESLRKRLPFKLLGLDMDNGSEFINYSMLAYAKEHQIALTRSRAYHKNDNAHVEQKNWTAIRQLVGYSRYDTDRARNLLNSLYSYEWRLYLNFFQPTMKIKETKKDLVTGKKTRYYYQAKTPYQRLMEHPEISVEQKVMLKSVYDSLNPIELQRRIDQKLNLLAKEF